MIRDHRKNSYVAIPAVLILFGVLAFSSNQMIKLSSTIIEYFSKEKQIAQCDAKVEWQSKVDIGIYKPWNMPYVIHYAKITPYTPEPYWLDIKAHGDESSNLKGLGVRSVNKAGKPWQLKEAPVIGNRIYNPRGMIEVMVVATKPGNVRLQELEFRCANGAR